MVVDAVVAGFADAVADDRGVLAPTGASGGDDLFDLAPAPGTEGIAFVDRLAGMIARYRMNGIAFVGSEEHQAGPYAFGPHSGCRDLGPG